MTRCLIPGLIAAARGLGPKGARLQYTRQGPCLEGRFRGHKLRLPLPSACGAPLPNGRLMHRLARALTRAIEGRPDPLGAAGEESRTRKLARPPGAVASAYSETIDDALLH